MKISWGIKIALTYILFVLGVLIMVVIFMNQDVNLVADDYYAKELSYQQQIDKENRTSELTEQASVRQEQNRLIVNFPAEFRDYRIEGKINFYRPSESRMDFSVDISRDAEGRQIIPRNNIAKGLWKIKIDWSANGSSFYNESTILLE